MSRYLDTHNIERHPAPCPEWPHDLGLVRNLRQVLDTAARGAAVTAWETRDGEEADMFWVSRQMLSLAKDSVFAKKLSAVNNKGRRVFKAKSKSILMTMFAAFAYMSPKFEISIQI